MSGPMEKLRMVNSCAMPVLGHFVRVDQNSMDGPLGGAGAKSCNGNQTRNDM
jgi:hypothetical protein